MFDLFRRKADVYIRQLQVRMRIFAINSPVLVNGASSGLRDGDRWANSDIEHIDNGDRRANSDIEHHIFANINAGLLLATRHRIVLRKEGGDGGGGETRQIVRQLVKSIDQ